MFLIEDPVTTARFFYYAMRGLEAVIDVVAKVRELLATPTKPRKQPKQATERRRR